MSAEDFAAVREALSPQPYHNEYLLAEAALARLEARIAELEQAFDQINDVREYQEKMRWAATLRALLFTILTARDTEQAVAALATSEQAEEEGKT